MRRSLFKRETYIRVEQGAIESIVATVNPSLMYTTGNYYHWCEVLEAVGGDLEGPLLLVKALKCCQHWGRVSMECASLCRKKLQVFHLVA
jgi:hypothetical protein